MENTMPPSKGLTYDELIQMGAKPVAEQQKGFSYEELIAQGAKPFEASAPPPVQEQTANAAVDFVSGVPKGLGRGIYDQVNTLAQAGQFGLNQTAGRTINAVMGRGPVPIPSERLAAPREEIQKKVNEITRPTGISEQAGFGVGYVGSLVPPGGAIKATLQAPEAIRASRAALEAVAPKLTAKGVRTAYEQGRAKVGGILGKVSIDPDRSTKRAAEAVRGLVKGKNAAEDSVRVYEAIGKEADTLAEALAKMDVQPILQADELAAMQQKVIKEIMEDPDLVGNAGESATRMFNKFQNLLPKGKDITASDLLKARKQFDKWVEASSKSDVFDPAIQNAKTRALRIIRQDINRLITEKAPDVKVQESLARQSAMYDALENIATKGPKEVGTNAPGRFLQSHPMVRDVVRGGLQGLIPFGAGAYIFDKLQD